MMLQNFLNSNLILPSVACFFLGSFGYIILKLWLIPLIKYNSAKRKVFNDLYKFSENQNNADIDEIKTRLRRHAATLTTVFNNALPYWYRLHLGNRGESPIDAAKTIMKLVNTKNKIHINTQIDNILNLLNKTP